MLSSVETAQLHTPASSKKEMHSLDGQIGEEQALLGATLGKPTMLVAVAVGIVGQTATLSYNNVSRSETTT